MASHKQVQQEMAKAKEAINLALAVERLQETRDFKLVFTSNLFKEHILNVVADLHLYEAISPEHINAIAELEAVSRTKSYLSTLITKGQCAKADLEDAKDIPDSELD